MSKSNWLLLAGSLVLGFAFAGALWKMRRTDPVLGEAPADSPVTSEATEPEPLLI